VRFRREGEVFALTARAINAALQEHQGGFRLLTSEDRAKAQAAQPSPIVSRTVVKPVAPPAPPMVVVQERFMPVHHDEPAPAQRQPPPTVRLSEPPQTFERPAAPVLPAMPPSSVVCAPSVARAPVVADDTLPPGVRRVSQVNDMYLLIETDRGLRLIDQHALHEKALWQALDARIGDLAGSGVQHLAVPIVVQLTAGELAAITPVLPEIAAFGIEAERFGPTSVAIRAHPAALARCNWARFLAELANDGASAAERLTERIRHSAACHAAVKAGQRLEPRDQRELVRLLYTLEGLEHCPHGRPTTLDLGWDELSKRFQR
jgi:DNA mismatch repair protein MutL